MIISKCNDRWELWQCIDFNICQQISLPIKKYRKLVHIELEPFLFGTSKNDMKYICDCLSELCTDSILDSKEKCKNELS